MQRLDVQLEDDLTGGPADETVVFGVDGRDYQIDLNAKHAAAFHKQLAAFTKRARSVRRTRGRSATRSAASRDRSRQIRVWAERQGFKVAAHGRLLAHVVQEYDRSLRGGQPTRRRKSARSRQAKRNP
jgi:nucleoid-associated protein Lsr2